MLIFFFVNFAWKKSSVRSIGKRFCFCPLYILSLPQIMKKLCCCHSNIIFEEVWRYVSGSKGRNRCFNRLMGHVDLKTLQIALSLEKTGKCPHHNHWQKSWKEAIGVYYFSKWHIPNPFPHSTNNVGRVFPEFSPSFSFGRVQVRKLQSIFQ